MGALLQKLLGGGPLIELGHVECCNDEVRSSSSSESCRTHASGHVDTARADARARIDEVTHAVSNLPRDPKVTPDIPWASPAEEGHAVTHLPSTNRAREM